MLATPASAPPTDPDCIMEPKYDGWRAICTIDPNKIVGLRTRTGSRITTVPYIERLAATLPPGTILDGEIVDLASERQWNRTQSILSRKKPHEILTLGPDNPPLVYRVFDLLEVQDENVMGETLATRRKLLSLLLKALDRDDQTQEIEALIGMPLIEVVEEQECGSPAAAEMFERLMEQGYEGVVCKRLDSIYSPGSRNGAWVKVKPELEMDVEVTGTYPASPGSKYEGNSVGGITFKATHPDGLMYEGRCAGMDDDLREQLFQAPENFVGRVAEVAYASVGDEGALRFPRFKRLRDEADKSVAELVALIPQEGEKSDGSKGYLLARCIDAEGKVEELEAEVKRLQARLQVALDVNAAEQPEPMHVEAPPIPAPRKARQTGVRGRNFKAMGHAKLLVALQDLEHGSGDAFHRATEVERRGGPSVTEHLQDARKVAKEKGLI